jgi:hypothetical protein
MTLKQIALNLQALNGSAPAKKPVVKKTPAVTVMAAPAVKTNGHAVLSADEQLRLNAARIVAAFSLTETGVTVDALVAGVKAYEAPYAGAVQ